MRSGRCFGIVWAQFGPYHFARASALGKLAAPTKLAAIEIGNETRHYEWHRANAPMSLLTLCAGSATEDLPFFRIFIRARKVLSGLGVSVCFLPSYAPKQSTAVLLAAKSIRLRTVMMNESHAGTARATGVAGAVKRQLVRLFDAAIVGGRPQRRYFARLGIPEDKIFTGYDAVDNDHFSQRAEAVRAQQSTIRSQYGLPEHYFLSLGRFVQKKNLSMLIRAFRLFLEASTPKQTHLVLVGSGREKSELKSLCREYGLVVYDKEDVTGKIFQIENRTSKITNGISGVHFYGFRQIDDNPVFYALADAFILTSLWEEWGLVVNEAMASSLPVVVSRTAGCVEDLLEPGISKDLLSPDVYQRVKDLGLCELIRENGFVFDSTCSDELSRILVLLESCGNLRTSMGRASRQIINKFSCENFAKNALLAAEAAMARPLGGRRHSRPSN